MKFLTYRSTPGLDHYPEQEQFKVWQEAHRYLMHADYSYARQHQTYIATMTKASVLPAVAMLPLGLGATETALARFFHLPVSYGVYVIVAGVLFLLWSVIRILRLANGQQRFMNDQIAGVLRQRAAA